MLRAEKVSLAMAALLVVVILGGSFSGLWTVSAVLAFVPYFALAGILGVLVWGFRGRIEVAVGRSPDRKGSHSVPPADVASPAAGKNGSSSKEVALPDSDLHRSSRVCATGPYSVPPYRRVYVSLEVEPTDRITGTLVEAEGQEFNWCIVGQRDLVSASKNDEYRYAVGEVSCKAAAEVRWRVPRPGPWFLLFDHSMRQNPREISVELRRD